MAACRQDGTSDPSNLGRNPLIWKDEAAFQARQEKKSRLFSQPNFIIIHFGYYVILTPTREGWQFNIFMKAISNAWRERAGTQRGGC
jgi:hypothetical protein